MNADKPRRSRRAVRPNSALIGLALVALAGTLAVWRPWATPPELPAGPPDTDRTPAQIAAAAAGQILSQRLPRAPASERLLLVVLPFSAPSETPEQAYFSDGLTEMLIQTLARTPGFSVAGYGTTSGLKSQAVNAQTVGQALSTRFVLETSVGRTEDSLSLSARLIDTASGNTVWAERFDRKTTEIFLLQDEFADRILTQVAPQLRRREATRAAPASAGTLHALDLTLRARQLTLSGERTMALDARALLEQAIARDPSYVPAYTLLHRVLNLFFTHRWTAGFNSPETAQAMLDIAGKAVTLAPSDPIPRAAYAESLTLVGQHATAVAQIESVVSASTVDSALLRSAATILDRSGEFEKSITLMKRAVLLDPGMPPEFLASPFASSLYQLGRYAEAADQSAHCLRRAPTTLSCRLWYVASLAQAGRTDEARRHADELMASGSRLRISDMTEPMTRRVRDIEYLRHAAEGLRKAGIPE